MRHLNACPQQLSISSHVFFETAECIVDSFHFQKLHDEFARQFFLLPFLMSSCRIIRLSAHEYRLFTLSDGCNPKSARIFSHLSISCGT